MIIPVSIAPYRRYDLPNVKLRNLYVEKTPSSRTQLVFLPRPALERYQEMGSGPIRGMFGAPGALGGSLFAVSGDGLYKDGALLGSIPGSDRVSMASSSSQLLVANDAALYLTDGATVSTVAFPDDAGVSSVAYIDGYFLAARTGTQRFYWSTILDGSAWDALDYASAERQPDNLVAITVVNDRIFLFGEIGIEPWVTTGNGDTPFQRIEGQYYNKGCKSRDTIALLDNTVFFVGHDNVAYRIDDRPVRISDNGIEEAIQNSTPEQLRAWAWPWNGNIFYSLSTAYGTFAYNPATDKWTEMSSYGRDIWRAHIGVFLNGEVYAGDDEEGVIWRLQDDVYTDDGVNIERRWTVLIGTPGYLDNIMIDANPGQTLDPLASPICECRISRDAGQTFSDYRQAGIGRLGQYRKRIVFRRWGMVDAGGAVLDFRLTDPVGWMIGSMRANESQGGKGRPA